MTERSEIPSPCIAVCRLDLQAGVCVGCYRTVDEIGSWSYFTEEERRRVIEAIGPRRPTLAPWTQPDWASRTGRART